MNEDEERTRWLCRQVVLSQMPVRYASDVDVQRFVEEEAALMGPIASFAMSAAQLTKAARKKFGAASCRDLIIRVH
jgi:hypothetical protein